MKRTLDKNSGMAMVYVLLVITVVIGALGLVMVRVSMNEKGSEQSYNQVLLEEAAQAGVDYAVQKLWNEYKQTVGNTTSNWASYRGFLNDRMQIPINEDLNFDGVQGENEGGNGKDGFQTLPEGVDRRGIQILEDPLPFLDPATETELATIDSVYVSRYDTVSQARLTVRATASAGGRSLTAVQTLRIGGGELTHGQFAILANNISCILCHAEITSLDLDRNADPELYGEFDRVKIAALQSLLVRTGSEPNSSVAGTIYTRGEVYRPDGSLYGDDGLASTNFNGREISGENGTIVQDSGGNMSSVSLRNADVDAEGLPDQFSNLYMNYPEDPDLQSDGPLPTNFPIPFPDENTNRIVDDDEFAVVMNSVTGAVEGGLVYGVPRGGLYDGEALPGSSNDAEDVLAETGSYDGNIFLLGTEDNPIRLDGKIAINGDLVIAGPIIGEGNVQVRGNTYVVGDVQYKDAAGVFGQNEEGGENALAIIGGGSIMLGDYLTIRGVNDSSQNNKKYPAWNRYSIHTRDEHRSNTYYGQELEWGYFDDWSSDPGEEVPGKPGQQFSFTQSELQLFNNLELEKALEDPNYIPRFYGLRESQPNNIYLYDADDEHSVRYSESGVKLLGDYLIENDLPLELLDRAIYQYTSPEGNWISEDTLRQIWYNDEMTRPSSGRPFKFDGLLYSSNAIFAIVRSDERHNSNAKGKMELRGGVIASDLGVFVPGGLGLQYDKRVERFLDVQDTELVAFRRTAFLFVHGDGSIETGEEEEEDPTGTEGDGTSTY